MAKKRTNSSLSQSYKSDWFKNKNLLAIFVIIIFAGLGTYIILRSYAESPYASVEAESGVLSGGANIVSDSNASGGQAVQFGSGSGSGTVAFVQADDTGTFNGNDTSIGSGTYNQVLAHDTGIGHTVILVIQTLSASQTDTVQSVSSGMGSFQFVNSYNDEADNEIWVCEDTTGAADTMTVNTSTNAWDAFAIEFNQPATGFVNGGGQVANLDYLADQSWTLSPVAAGNVALVAVDTADAYESAPSPPWTYYNNGYWDFDNGTSAAWQVTSSASPITATWVQDGGLVATQGVVVQY